MSTAEYSGGLSPRRQLPDNPSREYLRKEAKRLVRLAAAEGRPTTLARVQHEIAREYGVANWAELGRTIVGAQVASVLREAVACNDIPHVVRTLDARPELLRPSLWPAAIFQAKSLEMTELLLARGLDPNQCSAPRKSLHFAVDRKRPDITAALLRHGAKPDVTDGEGFTPLDLYAGLAGGYGPTDAADRENVALLLAAGAQPNLWTWIRLAETERALAILRGDPELIHAASPDLGFLPLHVAARMADVVLVQYLIDNGADVNAGENTALWFVCQSGADPKRRLRVMEMLLRAGAQVNRACEENSTALHYAAWRGPVAVAELLLSAGAQNGAMDDSGHRPVYYARHSPVLAPAEKAPMLALLEAPRILDPAFSAAVTALDAGDETELRRLLRAHPGLSTARAEEPGWYAGQYFRQPFLLEFVAENPVRKGSLPGNIVDLARAIVEAGAPREAMDKTLGLVASGRVARESGAQAALLQYLVSAGAEPSCAVRAAASHGEFAAVQVLLELGAVADIVTAAALGRVEDVERAMAKAGEAAPQELEEPLHAAIRAGQLAVVQCLMDGERWHGSAVPVSKEIMHAGTPLHHAASFGQLEIARWLVAQGAPLDARDRQYNGTPLGWAEHCKQDAVAQWLRTP